jgi:queuine tRNA-ribosyltransferase
LMKDVKSNIADDTFEEWADEQVKMLQENAG